MMMMMSTKSILLCCQRIAAETILLSYAIDQTKLLFWKKCFFSDNQTLRCISWLIRNRFIAVGSVYGVWSSLQSAGSIKESIWLTFAQLLGSSR